MEKRLLIFFVFSTALLLFGKNSIAQLSANTDIKFRTYTTKDGLVYDDVVQVDEDSKGFLWIATNHGISRFDGVQFKNFLRDAANPRSIPDNFSTALAIDKNDRVWLALKNGLCYYDQRTDSFSIILYQQKALKCRMLAYDRLRNAMVAVDIVKGGYYTVDCTTLQAQFYPFQYEKLDDPNALGYAYIDSKHRLWIPFTRSGYYTINLNNHQQFYFKENIWPLSFLEDSQGNIWCSTWQAGFRKVTIIDDIHQHTIYGDDFVKYVGGSWNFVAFAATENKKLIGDSMLMVVTETGGIRLLNKNAGRFTKAFFQNPYVKEGAPTNNYNYAWTNKKGITWLGSWQGLIKINKEEQQFNTSVFPSFDLVRSYSLFVGMADDPADSRYSWLITCGSGIHKIEKATGRVVKKAFYFFDDADTTKTTGEDKNFNWRWNNGALTDRDKNIWITGNYGLILISKKGIDTFPLFNAKKGKVTSLYPAESDSALLIGTPSGICVFNKYNRKYRFVTPSWPNHPTTPGVKQLKPINQNRFAFCSRYGAAIFDKKTETFRYLRWKLSGFDSVDQHTCRSVEVVGDNIYFGTHAGLLKYNISSDRAEMIGVKEGIDRFYDNTLKADAQGNLWAIANHGLFKYLPSINKFEKFTTADGIYNFSHDFIAFYEYQQKFYLGFRGAYTSYDPALVNQNDRKLTPIFTDVFVKEKRIKFFDSAASILHFSHLQNDVTFGFSAPDFTNADKIVYAVKLDGFDKDWRFVGSAKTVTYNNLLPGDYVFMVKVANSSGVWGQERAGVRFSIVPAWWQRKWFLPILFLTLTGLIAMAAGLRVKKIRQREEQKTLVATQLAELEMKALRSQMNPHFIFNSLNSIQKYIWENKKENASDYLADFSTLIRMILNASGHKTIPLSKEIEMLRAYIALEHRRSNNRFNYHIFEGENLQTDMVQIPPLLLQPYIENAVWHGLLQKAGNGNLELRFEQRKDIVICTIDDDGIGRKKAQEIKAAKSGSHASVGLGITEQRVKLMHHNGRSATVDIIDKTDANGAPTGTKIILKIPV